jgi:hypothetical protein
LAISPVKLNIEEAQENVMFNTEDHRVRALIEPVFNRKAVGGSSTLATFGEEVDLRMALQLGVFTIHGTPVPLEQHRSASVFLRKLVVPAGSKKRIRAFLWHLGIRRSNLFPDLENLAIELSDLDFDL